jgi:hypothetical protein
MSKLIETCESVPAQLHFAEEFFSFRVAGIARWAFSHLTQLIEG